MEEDQTIENSLLRNEAKGLDYYLEQAKLTAFQVLYVLRKDEEQEDGMALYYIQTALDYFQQHQFPFYVTIYFIWKQNTFMQYLQSVENLFQISTYFPSLSFQSLILTMYVLLFFIILMLADIIYVSWSFSRNKFKYLWPLYVLRTVASYVVTILFLPITESLTSMLQCYVDENGQFVIYGYSSINWVCWEGWYNMHAIIDLFFIAIFCSLCSVVAYAFFEPSMTSKDRTARQNAFGDVVFITNKITCQLMYCLLRPNYNTQAWIMAIVTWILALWLWKVFNFDEPYYDFDVGLFYKIASSYYLWTCSWLLISQILYNTTFDGTFIGWFVGLPFILSVMILTKKSKIETLISSQKKFRSGESIWGHIRYVLQLIQSQSKDQNSYMLLIGYIEKHKETCEYDDCPLKLKSLRKNKKLSEMEDMCKALILELDRMFVNGLKKFPQSTELRIFYALFCMERRNNKHRALEQFELASFTKPALYQQFIIYRFKRDIKKGSNSFGKAETKASSEDDIVNLIAFNNHMIVCEEMMKFSANLHKEFWNELRDDQPNLARLMNIGARISSATNEAKDNFNKMQKINASVPQTVKIFGTFVLQVLNDTKKAAELLGLSKELAKEFRARAEENKDQLNVESQPIPFVQVSAKKSDQGQIMNMNSLLTTYFGYGKEEMLGKKINMIIPSQYHKMHDKYMHSFFENIVLNLRQEQETVSDYLDIDQSRLFKHKNGYLISLIYKVSLNLEQLMYTATFKGEAQTKTSVYFIVDKNTEIKEISTGAISFFDLELKQLASERVYKLNDYIPDVLKKNGKDVISKIEGKDLQYYFNCTVKEIILPDRRAHESDDEQVEPQHANSGFYIVKLDKIERNEANLKYLALKGKGGNTASQSGGSQNLDSRNSDSIIKAPSQTKLNMPSQQSQGISGSFDSSIQPLKSQNEPMDVDPRFAKYMQDLFDVPKQEDFKELFRNMNADTDSLPSVDYSGSINTKRLWNDMIISIDEEKQEQFLLLLEEEEEENSLFRNNNNVFEDEDDYKLFTYSNSAQRIKTALNTPHSHSSVTIFRAYSTFWILFVIIITSLQYYFCVQQFNDYQKDVEIIEKIYQQLIAMNQIGSRLMDFAVNQYGLYKYNITSLQTDIQSASDAMILFNYYMNSNYYNSFAGYYDEIIQFRFYDEKMNYQTTGVSLESSILLLGTLALNCSVADQSMLGFNNQYLQSGLYNYFQLLTVQLSDISLQQYNNIKQVMSDPQIQLLVLLGVSIFVSMLSMTKFIFLMFDIKTQRENILFLFLDIPVTHVEVLYKKCDKFLKNYISIEDLKNKNELEGYESSENEHQQDEVIQKAKGEGEEEDDTQLKQQQNRRKIIKKYRENRIKGNQSIIIQFIFIALFTLLFTMYNILTAQNIQSEISFILPQYYQSMNNVYQYGYYLNIYKLMLLNNTYSINGQQAQSMALQNLTIFTGNAQNLNNFFGSFLSDYPGLSANYLQIYYGNLCNYITFNDSSQQTVCKSIIEGNLEVGVYNAEAFYLQYFRQQLESYAKNTSIPSLLLSDDMFYQIDRSLYNYLSTAVLTQIDEERTFLLSSMDSANNIQLILLIVFIIILVGVFLVIWLPYLSKLNMEINQTIEMLNMVPLGVIKENKSIRRFVKNLIKAMNFS